MKKQYFKSIGSILITIIFFVLAFGSGSSDEKIKIDINNKIALEKYIQGKWSWEKHTGDINHTWRYRFEIEGNKLKIWSCFNNIDDPFDMSEGYEEFNFTLGNPTRDVDGYKTRYLEFAVFDKTNFFGLTYESLSPFWLVSDDNWDTPVLRCGSGIPSWSRTEFQSSGTKKNHEGNSYSNLENENTTAESINQNEGISDENNTNDVSYQTTSENTIETNASDEVFTIVEEMPSFTGGETAYSKYIATNIKYPEEAASLGIEGTCYVEFIVEKDGSLTNISIRKGVTGNGVYGQSLDNEALRVVKLMPKWNPGKQNDNNVRVKMNLPIKFVLK